jgi:hypothetical protein
MSDQYEAEKNGCQILFYLLRCHPMLERKIEQHFRKLVASMGGIAFKWVSPGYKGVADRIAILPNGVVWLVELKAPKGRLSALQQDFAEKMLARGQNYACLKSIEEVDQWHYEITNKKP